MDPTGNQQKRKLAAILFADIVGYTAMMQEDERGTLEKIQRYQNVIEETLPKYDGELVKKYGDGSLMVFSSSLKAMQCAVEMQKRFWEDPKIPLRIGMHIGEIIFDKGDIFGDGVNLASRIESMGVAGSILLSRNVYQKIRNQQEFQIQPLGSFEFKNVREPMKVYALANEGFAIPPRGNNTGKFKSKKNNWLVSTLIAALLLISGAFAWNQFFSKSETLGPALTEASGGDVRRTEGAKASIAVLPFKNMSADKEQQYFSDGVSEEILNALTQLKDLKVSARTSSFQFRGEQIDLKEVGKKLGVNTVLEGSVRKSGNQVRIIVNLINIEDGFQLWSDRYDRELTDIFAVQDEIAQAIVKELQLTLAGENSGPLVKVLTENQEAYDLYLKAIHFIYIGQWFKSIDLLEEAIKLDPGFAEAYAWLSWNYFAISQPIGWILDPEIEAKVRSLAVKAMELDSTSVIVHWAMTFIYHDYDNDYYKAQKTIEKVLEDRPSSDLYIHLAHNTLYQGGSPEKAINYALKSVELDPLNVDPYNQLGIMYIAGRKEKEALALAKEMEALFPNELLAASTRGSIYEFLKDYDQAFNFYQQLLPIIEATRMTLGYISYLSIQAKVNPEEARVNLKDFKTNPEWAASPFAFAVVHMALGEKEQAYYYLEQAFELREFTSLRYLKWWPAWDEVRSEPRFEAFIKRLELKD